MNGLPYMTKLSLPIKVKKQRLSVNDTSPHNMQNGKDGQLEQLALAGPELKPRESQKEHKPYASVPPEEKEVLFSS